MTTTEIKISDLILPEWNPRKIKDNKFKELCSSIENDPEFLQARPVIASNRTGKLVAIAGTQRVRAAQFLGLKTVPVIIVTLTEEKEKDWSLKDNLHQGEWDWGLLANFEESFLSNAGFSSEDLDKIFGIDENQELFDLAKELKKLQIEKIEIQKGDVWQLGDHKMLCGDSTIEADILKLMNGEKADMCFTDPPYILDYLKGKKKNGEAVTGFGAKRDRRYLETDSLPPDFTEKWMANVAKIQKPNFSIIVFEHPKNLRTIWNELEKHWKYRNTIVWRLPNRVQGFAAKYKFFNKHDIALVGTVGDIVLNLESEQDELLQADYLNAIFATAGQPHWEPYAKRKKYCPTDFIDYKSADEKSSGQGIIFGTKPTEILIPYIKVLTQRNDLIIEPFGGSGSTLIAAEKMKRRCYLMEKVPTYAEVIRRRWEKLTGRKAKKIN